MTDKEYSDYNKKRKRDHTRLRTGLGGGRTPVRMQRCEQRFVSGGVACNACQYYRDEEREAEKRLSQFCTETQTRNCPLAIVV